MLTNAPFNMQAPPIGPQALGTMIRSQGMLPQGGQAKEGKAQHDAKAAVEASDLMNKYFKDLSNAYQNADKLGPLGMHMLRNSLLERGMTQEEADGFIKKQAELMQLKTQNAQGQAKAAGPGGPPVQQGSIPPQGPQGGPSFRNASMHPTA